MYDIWLAVDSPHLRQAQGSVTGWQLNKPASFAQQMKM
ncbi:hypothetical protein RAS1_24480 [Phycisphaerae bacterium RAS1]|nr:hypothetical protein RAS1_24480 [Phycisphaerae bacterium RAS1]